MPQGLLHGVSQKNNHLILDHIHWRWQIQLYPDLGIDFLCFFVWLRLLNWRCKYITKHLMSGPLIKKLITFIFNSSRPQWYFPSFISGSIRKLKKTKIALSIVEFILSILFQFVCVFVLVWIAVIIPIEINRCEYSSLSADKSVFVKTW